jgi:hypothetical protein
MSARMRVILRAHGGGNRKPRPEFFSKRLCALSLLRAAQECVERPWMVLLVDGDVPDDFDGIPERFDEVVDISGGSTKRSYTAAVDFIVNSQWDDDDFVFLCEDDYLLRPFALDALQRADAELGGARYLCGYEPDNSKYFATVRTQRTVAVPADVVTTIGDVSWKRIVSTTSTFAMRVGVLRRDRTHHFIGAYSGSAFDHTIAMSLAGEQPYRWTKLLSDLKSNPLSKNQALYMVARPVMRSANNVLAALPRPRHYLYCSTEPLMTHMEPDYLAPGVNWQAEADAIHAWDASLEN